MTGAAGAPGGGIRWMFHATAMAASYDDVLDPLRTLFGCRVMHDNEALTPGIERRGGMTWIGDNSIEIGEPLGATPPVRRFLDRFGSRQALRLLGRGLPQRRGCFHAGQRRLAGRTELATHR